MSEKDSKLSKKYQRHAAQERADFEQSPITSEDDPRIGEAVERLGMLEMDDIYEERQLQKAFQDIVEKNYAASRYTAKDRLRAALAYRTTGSTLKAAELTGINHNTIRYWKAEAQWWPVALEYARKAMKEETSAQLYNLQVRAMDEVRDRLENGEETAVRTREGVEIVRTKVKAKDAMYIAVAAQDKQAVLAGEAQSITETRTQTDVLNQIAEKLQAVIAAADAKVIEGVVIRDEEDEK